jgi:hypothetical protein
MAFYVNEDGEKVTYPASAIWKIGVPVVVVALVVVALFMF